MVGAIKGGGEKYGRLKGKVPHKPGGGEAGCPEKSGGQGGKRKTEPGDNSWKYAEGPKT